MSEANTYVPNQTISVKNIRQCHVNIWRLWS